MSNIFWAQSKDGKLSTTDYNRLRLMHDLKTNDGAKYRIERVTVESRLQRRFYEGGVIKLWVYLDGNDYKNSRVCKHYHDQANREFNGDIIVRNGKSELIGLSSKGKLERDGLCEKVIEFLEEQYSIDRTKVLDPAKYKYWRDALYSTGEFDTYIDYLKSINAL